jgi:hypothetical protein
LDGAAEDDGLLTLTVVDIDEVDEAFILEEFVKSVDGDL